MIGHSSHLPPQPPGLEQALGMLLVVLGDPLRSAAMFKSLGNTRDEAMSALLQVEEFRKEKAKAEVELTEMRRKLNADQKAFEAKVAETSSALTDRELAVSVREVQADDRDKRRRAMAAKVQQELDEIRNLGFPELEHHFGATQS
jgi:hypothetical protein